MSLDFAGYSVYARLIMAAPRVPITPALSPAKHGASITVRGFSPAGYGCSLQNAVNNALGNSDAVRFIGDIEKTLTYLLRIEIEVNSVLEMPGQVKPVQRFSMEDLYKGSKKLTNETLIRNTASAKEKYLANGYNFKAQAFELALSRAEAHDPVIGGVLSLSVVGDIVDLTGELSDIIDASDVGDDFLTCRWDDRVCFFTFDSGFAATQCDGVNMESLEFSTRLHKAVRSFTTFSEFAAKEWPGRTILQTDDELLRYLNGCK